MARPRGLILDGGCSKAWRELRRRLAPLGIDVRPSPPGLPDELLAELARVQGYIVVSTDEDAPRHGWVYVPQLYAERKGSRDLATHIAKLVFRGPKTDNPRGARRG